MKTELSVIERAAVALGASECEKQLNALVTASKDITIVTNAAGRDECHASAMKATKARTSIAATGKDARDDANAFSKAVIAEEKRLIAIIEPEEIRLKALRDEWDNKIAAEKAEKERVDAERQAAIQSRIDVIRNYPASCVLYTSAQIGEIINTLAESEISVDIFAERIDEAFYVMGQSIQQLESMLAGKKAQEELAAQVEAQCIENERIAASLAAQQSEAERVQREALKAEAERQRIQAEELAKQRAELKAMQRQIAEQQAEVDRQRVAAQVKQQLEAQAAQRAKDDADKKEQQVLQDIEDDGFRYQEKQEAKHIEEVRRRMQCAERERPGNVVQIKSERPSDEEIVLAISEKFHASTVEAIGWLRNFGKNFKEVA